MRIIYYYNMWFEKDLKAFFERSKLEVFSIEALLYFNVFSMLVRYISFEIISLFYLDLQYVNHNDQLLQTAYLVK